MVLVNTWARSQAEAVERDLLVADLVMDIHGIAKTFLTHLEVELMQSVSHILNFFDNKGTFRGIFN